MPDATETTKGKAEIYLLGYPHLLNTDSYGIPEAAPTYDVGTALYDLSLAGDDVQSATMTELATLMKSLGAVTAYNIDGGGSSTFFFDGEVRNRPSNGGERGTSDILYIKG